MNVIETNGILNCSQSAAMKTLSGRLKANDNQSNNAADII